jgi:NAD(P)-dependent dehydrogenase (short-subunit alcohol dehydrogenase family)
MVPISGLSSANAALKANVEALTAVFIGATSGIGLATLQAFAKHFLKLTAIVVGRSQAKFQAELENLKQINSNGEFIFLQSVIALIKDIDAVCETIKSRLDGRKIDIVFTSQGYISFNGRENNADGLDNSISLRYYGRVRFAQNLLPLLSTHARVISVLADGKEGKILEDDLDLERNYSAVRSADQFGSMMTLSWDFLAKQEPEKSFVHVFPGLVSTGLLSRSATGLLGIVMKWILEPIIGFFALKPEEAGERMLYYATAVQYEKGSWSLD